MRGRFRACCAISFSIPISIRASNSCLWIPLGCSSASRLPRAIGATAAMSSSTGSESGSPSAPDWLRPQV